jgi:hypothetical protein
MAAPSFARSRYYGGRASLVLRLSACAARALFFSCMRSLHLVMGARARAGRDGGCFFFGGLDDSVSSILPLYFDKFYL